MVSLILFILILNVSIWLELKDSSLIGGSTLTGKILLNLILFDEVCLGVDIFPNIVEISSLLKIWDFIDYVVVVWYSPYDIVSDLGW